MSVGEHDTACNRCTTLHGEPWETYEGEREDKKHSSFTRKLVYVVSSIPHGGQMYLHSSFVQASVVRIPLMGEIGKNF